MFDKSNERFPIKDSYVFLAHCGASPLYKKAFEREQEIAREHHAGGGLVFAKYMDILDGLRSAAADLLKTSHENLAFVRNSSEGISMIANGYPFQKGDRIISYVHEYPANYYPWQLQERRGVRLALLPDRDLVSPKDGPPKYSPCGWSMDDLEDLVTGNTRIIALSHVQFTSGFAADLKKLGEFCRRRDIDLVVDAAQSMGSLPVYPEEYNISALVSSGWKWLMGPIGTGLMYTSKKFRNKLNDVNTGAGMMIQGIDFLNHSWHPHTTAQRFEYSTCPISLAAALETSIRDLWLRDTPEDIRAELFRLQDIFTGLLDRDRFTPLLFPGLPRSSILSVACNNAEDKPGEITGALLKEKIVCSERGGYIRIAPHFYNTDEEMRRAAEVLNSITV